MKREHPIIFGGPMVRAIIEGRKTQTRRLLRPQLGEGDHLGEFVDGRQRIFWDTTFGEPHNHTTDDRWIRCPYGAPGDRLWVRETWGIDWRQGYRIDPCITYGAGNDQRPIRPADIPTKWTPGKHRGQWRPAIHMPRWATRLLLEVVSVRVERLCDISEADARAEGMVELPASATGAWWTADPRGGLSLHARDARSALLLMWAKLHSELSVAANPWVWVIEFRRVP